MPGAAKTSIINAFGIATGRRVYTLIGSIREPADICGYPSPIMMGNEPCMAMMPPKWAVDTKDGHKWIIFLDEILCNSPQTQAAMLRVVAEKVVGDFVLDPDVWIVAAANPADMAAAGYEFEPPMANRVVHLTWEMDWDGFDSGLFNSLAFPVPKFKLLPKDWRNSLSAVGASFVAFRRKQPSSFADYPKERSKAGAAWGSPRSWTNGVIALTAARSVGADKEIEVQLLSGCVGHAADEYFEWERKLDLPDPEELIAAAIRATKTKKVFDYKHPNRPDKVIAMIGAVTHAVISKGATKERWEAGMSIVEHAARHEVDVALAMAGPLARAVPAGCSLTPEVVNRLYPILKRALLTDDAK